MTMAHTVQRYLEDHDLSYELTTHPRTGCSMRTASVAGIPPHRLAKAVMLEDEQGLLMAVLPADRHVKLGVLRRRLGRDVGLATERSLGDWFTDCEPGAVPPLGEAYGLRTILDDELEEEPEIYLETGDHEGLARMSHDDFMRAMCHAERGHFAKPML